MWKRIGLTWLMWLPVAAGWSTEEVWVEFAAEVTRTNPKHPEQNTRGRMYVGRTAVRTEGVIDRQNVVMIHRPTEQSVWILFPDQKKYLVRKGVEAGRPPLPDERNSPCRTDPRYNCKDMGEVRWRDRTVANWRILVKDEGGQVKNTVLWVDRRLSLAIREEYEDGTVVEMTRIEEGSQPAKWFTVPDDYQALTQPLIEGAVKEETTEKRGVKINR